MTDFHERQEARRLRYLARAKKARADAQARFHSRAAQELEQAAGSPILIGHHSEGRHRRLFERRRREMRAGFALQKKAEHYERRAKSIGKGRIATEDPDAVALLTAKLKAAESRHARMKEANALIRDKKLTPLDKRAQLPALLDCDDARAVELLQGDRMGNKGFPPYALQNSSANISRMRRRLTDLEHRAHLPERSERYIDALDLTIVENVETNRLQLRFAGKPPADQRSYLKQRGFRWAPSAGVWQAILTANARMKLSWFLEKFTQ